MRGFLQRALERYTNFFGIILWRVFSVDIINFFVRQSRRGSGQDVALPSLGSWPRYNHVGEMICLASLFTTLKYYPSNNQIFRERVLRYARTVPRDPGERVVFEYVSVDYHFTNIARGVIDTRDLVYYASAIGIALYLATAVLQKRRWA